MAYTGWSKSLVLVVLGGCFDPTEPPPEDETEGDTTSASADDDDDDDGPTVSATMSATDPTAESGDPTGDPTGDPSGDPTGPTTTAEDSSATDPDSETSLTDDTGTPGCPSPNTCVDAAPDGWSGPVIVFRGDVDARPPACAVPYPVPDLEAFGDLSIPAASCDCDCTPPGDAYCDGGSVIYNATSATCDSPSTIFFVEDGCAEFGGEFFSIRYFEFDGSDVQIFGSDCTPSAEENIPPAEYGSIVVACGGANEEGTCEGDQVCVPAADSPFQDRLCVWQDGDTACPAGTAYTEKEVYYDTLMDERDCSTCSCGPLGGSCNDAAVIMRADPGCGGGAGSVIGDGMCAQAGIGADSAELTASPDPSCTPGGGVLEGDVNELGAHTICCTP